MTDNSIRQRVAHWNGKFAEEIKAVYLDASGADSFVDSLITLMRDNLTEVGASWLLKFHFECRNTIDADQIRLVYRLFPALNHWQAKLHVLQCMPYMPVPLAEKKTVERFVRQHLSEPNKFVRAWAYNGFYQLAVCFPEMQEEARQLFEMAMRDEPASVKARVRNIVKKGF